MKDSWEHLCGLSRLEQYFWYDLPYEKVEVKEEPLDLEEEEEQIFITVVSDFESDIDMQTVKLENDENIINGAKITKISTNERNRTDNLDKDGKKSSLCHICGKKISRMIPHMRRHDQTLNCDECLEVFRSQQDLDKHKIYHEDNKYPCGNCTLNFRTAVELCKHTIKHFGTYKCIFCPFETSHVASIIVHVNRHVDNMKFKCDICGRGFNTKYVMESHKQIHTGIRKYQCDFCPKRFTTENYKKGHMKFNHTKELTGYEIIYQCDVCSRVFSFEKSLIRHLSVIHDIGASRRVKCPVCSKIIANNFNLKMHMTVHTGEKRHMCELCGKPFRDKAHLKRHHKVHSKRGEYMKRSRRRVKKEVISNDDEDFEWNQEKPTKKRSRRKPRTNITWTCKKCLEFFSTRKLLQAHKKIHIRENSPTALALKNYKFDEVLDLYICNFCSAECQEEDEIKKHLSNNHLTKFDCTKCMQSFTEPYKFSVHNQKHNGGDYLCPLCSYKTPRMTCIQSHINRMHLQKFIYNCKTCGKGFNDQAIFREHDNEHLGIKPFTCVVCNKSYVFSKYLFAHQVRYHVVNIEGRLQNNQCGICMRIFAKDNTLEKHMKNRHENYGIPREKKLLCDICGQGFSRNDKLKIHYRIHTGVKPYACSYCPKSFIKKEYLVMHERVHNGERPYSCEYCGKCFNQSAPLRIHVRGHTGERPYVCQICDQGFISRSSLNFHRKNYCGGRQDLN